MLKTKAIVLHSIKYNDSSLITHCYTEQLGRQSFLLKGILSAKKGMLRKAYFQPLNQLEIVFQPKNNGGLQFLKEVKVIHPYQSIPLRIEKNAIVIFIAEVLKKVLQEEEANLPLYQFLESSLIWLDLHDEVQNFHLLFLLKISKFLGFYPNDENPSLPYFDLITGCFTALPPIKESVEGLQVTQLKSLLGMNFGEVNSLKLNRNSRSDLLQTLLRYFELHLQGFRPPKSLPILNAIFEN